ncbi:MAG: hypothetical protein RL358_1705 [Pseudomonadota bacterium]
MTQPLKNLFASNAEFKSIVQKTQLLNALQAQFVLAAPPYLAQCSHVSGLLFGTLSIVTANATAAAKIRQLAPSIVSQLRIQGNEVNDLRIKVQVAYTVPPPPKQPRQLSHAAHLALQQLEANLADTPLKTALHKLNR